MGKAWAAVVVWWQGKKTMLGGVLVIAAGVAGVWYGKLDAVSALGVVGLGLSIAGWSAKANRHQAELLAALQAVSQAAGASKLGKAAVISDLAGGAEQIGSSLAPGLIAATAASLHLSADTAADLALAIQHLAGNSEAILQPAPSNLTPITGGAAK